MHVVLTCDTQKLVDALAPLNAKERALLAERADDFQYKTYCAAIAQQELADAFPGVYEEFRSLVPPDATLAALRRSASMAHWAVGAVETLEESECTLGSLEDGDRYRVLADRGASWCQKWVDHWLNSTLENPQLAWVTIHELVERGLCTVPRSDAYLRKMAAHLWLYTNNTLEGKDGGPYVLSDFLRDHPQYLPDVWRLFEIESMGFLDVPGQWDEPEPGRYFSSESWAITLRRLSEEGLMDRGQLLEASLRGMGNDFKQNLLSGFGSFHEGLSPSTAEMVACQGQYAALLAAPSSRVVAFGMKMLKKLEGAKKLDDVLFVANATNVFDKKEKGPAKSVLALFKKITKRTASLRPLIVEAVAERGLLHPDSDIQEASLNLLEAWADDLDENTRVTIGAHVEEMATTLQDRARTLAGADCGATKTTSNSKPAADAERLAVPDLAEPWRSLAGVDAAQAAIESGSMPPPLLIDTGTVPVLTGLTPLRPVESMDDIMTLAGRLIEQTITALEMEQLLGAISETDPATEDNFDRLAAPLLKRMDWAEGELGHLLYTWLSRGKVHEHFDEKLPTGGYRGSTFWQYQHHRIRGVRARVLKGTFVPLLATPTHEGGWLQASALVERLAALRALKANPDTLDFIQALLRLAPDGREDAAAQLPETKDQFVRIVRWALTGEGAAAKEDDPDFWLAAARARQPRDTVDVKGLNAEALVGPDGREAARYSWIGIDEKVVIAASERKAKEQADKDLGEALKHIDETSGDVVELVLASANRVEEAVLGGGWLHRPLRMHFSLNVTPPWIHGGDHLSRPTVIQHAFPSGGPTMHRERVEFEWATTIWPHNRDPLYGAALLYIAHAYARSSSKKWPASACLEVLLEPDQPLTLPAALLLSLALFAPEGDLSRTAIDVLVEGIADGRIHPDAFAEALPRLCATGSFQPGRMAKYLAEVTQVSPLHRWVVAGMLQTVVARWKEVPKNGHHILALLLELLAQLGQPLDVHAAMTLSGIKAGGKSAKLVKQLLAVERVDGGGMIEAREGALQARITRAERWYSGTS